MTLNNIHKYLSAYLFLFTICLTACNSEFEDQSIIEVIHVIKKTVNDPHSFSNNYNVRTTHLHLNLSVNFEGKFLSGSVIHNVNNINGSDSIVFDVKHIIVSQVLVDGTPTDYGLSSIDELLGSALAVPVLPTTKQVEIFYQTTQSSDALMWLTPQQTYGKQKPFLFTQGEAILTRSWIPCQDTPGNRITYSADIKCDSTLLAVMSASNSQEKNEKGLYHFEMLNPIPTYLIAMAIGDLEFNRLGEKTGVYAEPGLLKKSASEFEDINEMIETAEALYGPYAWSRYDILVMPPSFPFGGMENPLLTFVTPTIIAGDKSLVTLIAHELAHSWSGNLVTNATWNDFWLNEGFTVYFENRIMEELQGIEQANMLFSIRLQKLMIEKDELLAGDHPEDTKLKLDLKGRDPDDGMNAIAYVKGALFLKTIESEVGRKEFDDFLISYFKTHQFQTLTTEAFISYLNYFLLDPNNIQFNVDEWVYGKGIPNNAVQVTSEKFKNVEVFTQNLIDGRKSIYTSNLDSMKWATQEWVHFIKCIPDTNQLKLMIELDRLYDFKGCGNSEIMSAWYVKSIQNGYKGVRYQLAEFLVEVGRRKFLKPIYKALSNNEHDKEFALKVYQLARENYHSISFNTIDEILNYSKP